MKFSYKIEFESEDAEFAEKMIAHLQIAYAETWRTLKARGKIQATNEVIEEDGVRIWEIE